MGSPRPVSYGDGVTGLWFGKDAGVYKFRIGQPGSNAISWDGATLNVIGAITVTGGNAAKTDLSNVTGAYAGSSSAGGPAKWVAPTVTVAAINGSGLYMGVNFLGYYNTSTGWMSYLDNAGRFYLSGSSGNALSWDGVTLTITGTVNATAGNIGGYTISGGNLSSGNVSLNYSGLIMVSQTSADAVGLTAFGIGGTGNVRFWIGNTSGTTRTFYILSDGSVAAVNLSASAQSFSARFVTPASQYGLLGGYSFTNDPSSCFTSDGTGRLSLNSSANSTRLFYDGAELFPEAQIWLGHSSFRWSTVWCVTVNQSSNARLKTAITSTRYATAFVLGLRAVDYRWKRNGTLGHGFLAQDVAALAPEFAGLHYDATGIADGLNYAAFTGPLVRAFQEIEARVRALEARHHHGE